MTAVYILFTSNTIMKTDCIVFLLLGMNSMYLDEEIRQDEVASWRRIKKCLHMCLGVDETHLDRVHKTA